MSRSSLRRLVVGLLASASFALPGCIKAHDDATVTSDGSGHYGETITIDLSAMKGIADAIGAAMGGKPDDAGMDGDKPAPEEKKDDPLEDMKKEWKDIEGLEVTKATSKEENGKVLIEVEAKFKTLEAYAKATGIEMNAELKKNDDGSWTLRFFSDESKEGGDKDAPGMGDPAGDMGAAMLPMFEGFMKELEMARKLKVPGEIVETNGTKGDDGTVSWKVTWEDIKKGHSLPAQTVTFKGDGLALKPFTVRREHKGGGMGPK
ncbi:MAG: hypothetical protein IT460_15950 [Planctomycetes bacterium]|nr:hypothetical protein [Planctomycetota bacterium]